MKNFQEFLHKISQNHRLEDKIEIYRKAVDLFQIQESELRILEERNNVIYQKIQKAEEVDQVRDVSELVKIKNRIQKEIERFGNVASNDDAPNQASIIKQRREVSLYEFLKTVKDKSVQSFSNISEINGISNQSSGIILISTILIGAVSIFLFLDDYNVLFILNGLIFFIANLAILFYAKNQHISKFEIDQEYTSYEDFLANLDKKEDDFLLNVAWVNALKRELIRINDTLTRHSNVEESITLEEKNELVKNNQRINEILNSSIQQLEYYQIKDSLISLELEELDLIDAGQEKQEVSHLKVTIPSLNGLDEQLKRCVVEYAEYLKGFYTVKFQEDV